MYNQTDFWLEIIYYTQHRGNWQKKSSADWKLIAYADWCRRFQVCLQSFFLLNTVIFFFISYDSFYFVLFIRLDVFSFVRRRQQAIDTHGLVLSTDDCAIKIALFVDFYEQPNWTPLQCSCDAIILRFVLRWYRKAFLV